MFLAQLAAAAQLSQQVTSNLYTGQKRPGNEEVRII